MERNCEPMNKNRIEGVAEQGERARFGEALVIKASGVDPVNPCSFGPLTKVMHILQKPKGGVGQPL